jgi:hypothetical protein
MQLAVVPISQFATKSDGASFIEEAYGDDNDQTAI